MTNLQKAKNLESDYLSQIQKLIETAGSQNQLSILLYGNENTLQTKLNRAKKSSPYKLISYLKILQDCEKAFGLFIDANVIRETQVLGRGTIWILGIPDESIKMNDSVYCRFGKGTVTGIESFQNLETGKPLNMALRIRKSKQ